MMKASQKRQLIMLALALLGLQASGLLSMMNVDLTEISLPLPVITNVFVLLGYIGLVGAYWLYNRHAEW